MLIQTAYKQQAFPAGPQNSPPFHTIETYSTAIQVAVCDLLFCTDTQFNKKKKIKISWTFDFVLLTNHCITFEYFNACVSCNHAASAAEITEMPIFQECCVCFQAGFRRVAVSFGRAANDLEHGGALM